MEFQSSSNEPLSPSETNELTASDLNEPTQAGVSKSSSTWGRKWALLLIVAMLTIYMIIVPTVEYVIARLSEPPKSGRVLTDMTFAEQMRLHSVTGVVMLTFLALGGTIGSFLNVVIFRTPRGKPLLWPPSSCASCGTRIQSKDNIPVLGWLLLSGRCRTCGAPISVRYPIVEALIATVFLALYYIELLSGGDNIPVRTPNHFRGIVWILLYTKWDLVGLYFYHCLMLSLVLSVAMMNFDGFRAPRRFAISLLIGFGLLSVYFPSLRPVSAPYVPAYLTCLIGFAVGGALGFCLQWLFPITRDSDNVTTGVLAPPQAVDAKSEAIADAAISETEVIEPHVIHADVNENELNQIDIETVAAEKESLDSPAVMLSAPLASTMETSSTDSQTTPQQLSRYGDRAQTPSATTDAAFVMALIGITLGPYAALSVVLLLSPLLPVIFLACKVSNSILSWTRAIPITLLIFIVAFSHQLLWAQIHRLLGFGG